MGGSRKTNSEGKTDRAWFRFFLITIGMEASRDNPKMVGFRRSFEPEESIKFMSCSPHFSSSKLETAHLSFGK